MDSLAELLSYFERAFDVLDYSYFESKLPKTILTIQSTPKNFGHASVRQIWEVGKEEGYEINLSAEHLNRSTEEILATLLHEMVHVHCREQGIIELTRSGTYHNKKFKYECEKRDLKVINDKNYGWSITEPTARFIKLVQVEGLNKDIAFFRKRVSLGKKKEKKQSSTRVYYCPSCEKKIRATSDVSVLCLICTEEFILKEK